MLVEPLRVGRTRLVQMLLQERWETLVQVDVRSPSLLTELHAERPRARYGGLVLSLVSSRDATRDVCSFTELRAGSPEDVDFTSFFSGPDCITGFLSFTSLSTSTTGSFQTLSGPVTAPAGTAHIWITGQNSATGAGTHIVNFDDFVLDNGITPVGAPIPALGEAALLALTAVFVAMGLAALRR